MAKATKKGSEPQDQEAKTKAAFDLKTSTVKKLKTVAAIEDRFQNDILEELLTDYFAKYEKANGRIPIKE